MSGRERAAPPPAEPNTPTAADAGVRQRVVLEPGAIRFAAGMLDDLGAERVLLVTGTTSFERSGARAGLEPALRGREVLHFDDFHPNPRLSDVRRALERIEDFPLDAVVGVGGGSSLDMAKLLALFAGQDRDPLAYVAGEAEPARGARPIVAIPTTAGSGSEATHFAVLYIDRDKHSVARPDLMPRAVLIDPDLLRSAPPAVMAASGMDALAQSIESYWSIHSTEASRALSGSALTLMLEHLETAVAAPDDAAARLGVARGAHLAGRAIDTTRTTAAHAVSYPITAHFGVPHGHAVGLMLPSLFAYNAAASEEDSLDPRGLEHVQRVMAEIAELLESDVDAAPGRIARVMDRIGLQRDPRALGIRSAQDRERIIENGFNPDRVNNNPRRLTEPALRHMLVRLMSGAKR